MTKWIRFDYKDDVGLFGILDSDFVDEHEGNIFENTKNRLYFKIYSISINYVKIII